MAVAKPVWWVSALLTRFEEQLPCRIGPQTHHSRINVQQNKESLIHISQWKFSLVISGLTKTLTKINGNFLSTFCMQCTVAKKENKTCISFCQLQMFRPALAIELNVITIFMKKINAKTTEM